ncbi:MAG: LssY C-terminal domain-containing protein [Gemmatimonadaceae bacterium]
MSSSESGHVGRQPSTVQRRLAIIVAVVASIAIALVYATTHWIAPRVFSHFDHAPEFATLPKRTTTAHHAKGDPINIAIVGTETELVAAMHAAGWVAATPRNRANDLAIAKSVLFNRPDSAAPVSSLYLFGRVQDLAFEREVGRSARSRHHVRFWLARDAKHDNRPIWLGDAAFDLRAGVTSTLVPTHHIAPDVDDERDTLVANLIAAQQVDTLFAVSGMGIRVMAHNAGGDRFDTDGEIHVVILAPRGTPSTHTDTLAEPPIVATKNRIWNWFHRH